LANWWDSPTVPWAVQNAYNSRAAAAPAAGVTHTAQKKFTFDQHLNDYAVLVFSGKNQWDVTQLVTNITMTESFSSPAYELDLTLAAPSIRATTLAGDASGFVGQNSAFETAARRGPPIVLNNLIKCGMGVRVFASRPDPSGVFIPLQRLSGGTYALANEIFRGFIFSKSRTGSSNQDELTLTVFDQMIYLAKNDYDTIFKNQTATQIIRSLCTRAGLKLAPIGKDFASTHANISRLVSYGNNLYDCCYLAIQKNKHLTGKYYRLRSEGGVVVLRQRVTPTVTWYLTDSTNIVESSFSESIEELVTGVQPKTAGKLGRASYGGSVVNANLEKLYGRMRKVQDLTNLKASEVPKAIKTFMSENGKPKIEASITIPCVNTMRAGDLIKVRESDTGIVGLWYVSQVTHTVSATSATTALQLVKTAQEAQVQTVTEATIDGSSSSNRHVTYDKVKGSNGKFIRYRVTAGVYVPSGKFEGTALIGDENLVKVDKHLASTLGGAGAFVQLQYGRFSVRCVVQVRGDYRPTYDVMVSQAAADHLGIRNGNKIFIYPLRKHTSGTVTGHGPGSSKYDSLILAAAKKYGVEAALIKGVMEQESGFDPNARSGAGAIGLMQLMPGTAASMGYRSSQGPLTSPSISIKYGTIYLRDQLHAFHTIELALAAYNGGPGVARRPKSSWPAETKNYVKIVQANYQRYKQAGFNG
jgi:transglycosylase-like protein with SLT domain